MGDDESLSESSSSRTALNEASITDELDGSLASSPDEERLMRSLLENDSQTIDDGHLVAEAIDRGVGSFTPDLMFQNLVQEYRNAKRLYGETLIRELTGYSPDYVRKNIKIPEFQHTLSKRIEANVEALKKRGVLDEQGFLTNRAEKLAALVLYTEELDALVTKGLGTKERKERSRTGEKEGLVRFRRSHHRFRDLSLKRSVRSAIKRGHKKVLPEDLKAFERVDRGCIQIVYALDASGSMRGEKLSQSKRAGIALSFRAIEEKNEVGLILFTSKIEKSIAPTRNFKELLYELTLVRAGKETDLARAIRSSIGLFTKNEQDSARHLILLTDAVPTRGADPARETIEAASEARNSGITISIVGISLDKEGESLARDVVEIGRGRLYAVKSPDNLDTLILDDYESIAENL